MATTESAKELIQKTASPKSLQVLIQESAKELSKALPAHMNAERLTRIALTCIRLNPELAKSTPESFLGALFTAAQTGVEPVAGRAALIPFWNSRKKGDGTWHKILETQYVLMYRGLVELFYRHEKAVEISWGLIREGDEVDWSEGTDAHLNIKPILGNKGPVKAYYACAKLSNGGRPFKIMTYAECLEHGQFHSKTFDRKSGKFYDSSPWATAFDAMALKTCLIQLAKLLPLSVELQRAIAVDETSRDFRKGFGDALDMPDTTNWEESKQIEEPITSNKTGKEIEFGK